jgi:hypothetical protein
MPDPNSAPAAQTAQRELDLERGDHAIQTTDLDGSKLPGSEVQSSQEGSISTNEKMEGLSRRATSDSDDDDPFALFPALSISMSSTRGPFVRRNTTTTLTRALTREETMQTLKSVRSRFTEARSEFDENVRHISPMLTLNRMISQNLRQSTRISLLLTGQKTR